MSLDQGVRGVYPVAAIRRPVGLAAALPEQQGGHSGTIMNYEHIDEINSYSLNGCKFWSSCEIILY